MALSFIKLKVLVATLELTWHHLQVKNVYSTAFNKRRLLRSVDIKRNAPDPRVTHDAGWLKIPLTVFMKFHDSSCVALTPADHGLTIAVELGSSGSSGRPAWLQHVMVSVKGHDIVI